jgi:hypothetical protein
MSTIEVELWGLPWRRKEEVGGGAVEMTVTGKRSIACKRLIG